MMMPHIASPTMVLLQAARLLLVPLHTICPQCATHSAITRYYHYAKLLLVALFGQSDGPTRRTPAPGVHSGCATLVLPAASLGQLPASADSADTAGVADTAVTRASTRPADMSDTARTAHSAATPVTSRCRLHVAVAMRRNIARCSLTVLGGQRAGTVPVLKMQAWEMKWQNRQHLALTSNYGATQIWRCRILPRRHSANTQRIPWRHSSYTPLVPLWRTHSGRTVSYYVHIPCGGVTRRTC